MRMEGCDHEPGWRSPATCDALSEADSLRADLARVTAERDEARNKSVADWYVETLKERDLAIARAEKAEAERAFWLRSFDGAAKDRDAAEALLLDLYTAREYGPVRRTKIEALLCARGLTP